MLEKAVDKVATELEREERKRIAAEQKEAEKAANARKREVARKQREIEKECLNILEKLVKRVEKDNDYEESGQPYVEGRLGKTAHKTPCFKVHGIPCLEYLAVQPQGVFMGIRNAEVEAAVRAAVAHEKGLLREAHQRHSHMLTLAKAPPRLGKGLNLKWVDPRQSGRPWTVICMRHVPKEPRPPAAAPSAAAPSAAAPFAAVPFAAVPFAAAPQSAAAIPSPFADADAELPTMAEGAALAAGRAAALGLRHLHGAG